ncbi:superoxide dismutase [archaeon]|jgi:Fe-Mn family superoxide dismutase|nr:superoxide dismutase [archaeon]MDD2477362.1 superoxide dismutase [Candidatus ainarchaeum sp.]MDD3084525.1 superoxide dismutase [Candidatus ainarchaeum sp.]MDD4220806.1 superoxide dismutase [Candidatus ainarchaeum sp.]MDD4662305.1 superoxide dismutase [Candidatus ainarchaeum sp.]
MSENKNILPQLPYSYESLEPHIDKETMLVHHTKHHQGYLDKFLKAIEGTDFENVYVNDILKDLKIIPEKLKTSIVNNGGGFSNHNFFWEILTPNSTKEPEQNLKKEIDIEFGSFTEFKKEFKEKALTLFGSGWVWLVLDKDKKLKIIQTKNQDSPLSIGLKPLLTIDLWEHAYYLNYQNKRADYVDNFWNVVNWKQVEYLFNLYIK